MFFYIIFCFPQRYICIKTTETIIKIDWITFQIYSIIYSLKWEICTISPAIESLATKEFRELCHIMTSHSFNIYAFGIMVIHARIKFLKCCIYYETWYFKHNWIKLAHIKNIIHYTPAKSILYSILYHIFSSCIQVVKETF